MKKKRIQYNELNEEIYESSFWTRSKIIFIGIVVLIIGFLINFSLEEKVNKFLLTTLSNNSSCPITFEKAELQYFAPKIFVKKMNLPGICFGQLNNKLLIDEIKITPDFPSITHFGLRFGLEIKAEDSRIKIFPIISPFSIYLEIDQSTINSKILHVINSDDKSPIAGTIKAIGFLKFVKGNLVDGNLKLESNNFHFPSQRISGFDLPLIPLNHFLVEALFERPGEMKVKKFEIGKPGKQIEINLNGKIIVSKSSFASSIIMLDGNMNLSQTFLTNFSFLSLMLPQGHADGKFRMKVNGPLFNPGAPQFQ